MFEVRQVLTRMRLGDTDRAIARAGLMGRRKLAQLRHTAEAAGWLDAATALPGDPELAVHQFPSSGTCVRAWGTGMALGKSGLRCRPEHSGGELFVGVRGCIGSC